MKMRKQVLNAAALATLAAALCASCATTVLFSTLAPSPVDIAEYPSVYLAPFEVSVVYQYPVKADSEARALAAKYAIDEQGLLTDAGRRSSRYLTDQSVQFFRNDLSERMELDLARDFLGAAVFDEVRTHADMSAALPRSATPRQQAQSLGLLAWYEGAVEIFAQDTLATTSGIGWTWDEEKLELATAQIVDIETGEETEEEIEVRTMVSRYWLGDLLPPRHLKAQRDPHAKVFAVKRAYRMRMTYRLLDAATGEKLLEGTIVRDLAPGEAVVLYDANADYWMPSFGNGLAKDHLTARVETFMGEVPAMASEMVQAVYPRSVRVVRSLEKDLSGDPSQRKAINSLMKHVREGRYEHAEKAFVALWASQHNLAAALNASILMEQRLAYRDALAFMDEVLASTDAPLARNRRRLLDEAARSYEKALAQSGAR